MQMDEDVGKVAQATPILICEFSGNVSSKKKTKASEWFSMLSTNRQVTLFFFHLAKALELFMQSLIDEACMETRAKNAKRLTAAHL